MEEGSILAWAIPWTEEPGGKSPWGSTESDMTEWLTLSLFILFESQLLSPENRNEHTQMPRLCTWLQSSQRPEGSCQSRESQPELVRTGLTGRSEGSCQSRELQPELVRTGLMGRSEGSCQSRLLQPELVRTGLTGRSEASCQSSESQPELVRTGLTGEEWDKGRGVKATNWLICTEDPRKGTAPRSTRCLLSHGSSDTPRKEGLWLSFI